TKNLYNFRVLSILTFQTVSKIHGSFWRLPFFRRAALFQGGLKKASPETSGNSRGVPWVCL
ncbi:hypothetical protein, partial [Novacetimonas hansenii]|uniref:hypothetical protein n=1 Tax=Novacetimonas hansenii TaxID=436 RepID=UPI001C4CBB3F